MAARERSLPASVNVLGECPVGRFYETSINGRVWVSTEAYAPGAQLMTCRNVPPTTASALSHKLPDSIGAGCGRSAAAAQLGWPFASSIRG
jgi:hypothetical protein